MRKALRKVHEIAQPRDRIDKSEAELRVDAVRRQKTYPGNYGDWYKTAVQQLPNVETIKSGTIELEALRILDKFILYTIKMKQFLETYKNAPSKNRGRHSWVANQLGMSRQGLQDWINRLGLTPGHFTNWEPQKRSFDDYMTYLVAKSTSTGPLLEKIMTTTNK